MHNKKTNVFSGGEIDWAHHAGRAKISLSQVTVFAKAIEKAKELTKEGEYERRAK